MMPFWYTAAWRAHRSGVALVRPTFVDFPDVEFEHDRDCEVVVDGAVFCSPSADLGVERDVRLPPGQWFHLDGRVREGEIKVPGTLEFTPVFFRAGRIVPMMTTVGKSTAQCREMALTIVVFEREDGTAEGDLYIDDYETRDYENGVWAHRRFRWENRRLSCVEGERSGGAIGMVPRRICDTITVKNAAGCVSVRVSLALNDDWQVDVPGENAEADPVA
jgi:alpha 1,3-glucosidase